MFEWVLYSPGNLKHSPGCLEYLVSLLPSPSQVLGLQVHISTRLQGEISKIFSGSNILSLQVSAAPDGCWTTAGRANFKQNRPLDWHEFLKHFMFLMFGEVRARVWAEAQGMD